MTDRKPGEAMHEALEDRKKRRASLATRRSAQIAEKTAADLEAVRGEQARLRAEMYARREARNDG
jgi:hypothetical protein